MTVTTLQPDDTTGIDNFINHQANTNNNGTNIAIVVGTATANRPRRGIMLWDVSAVTAGSTINSAILTLVCSAEASTTDYDVQVHRGKVVTYEGAQSNAAPAVGEDASIWNYRNANGSVAWTGGAGGAAGTEFETTATASTTITGTGTFTWDITADVAAWVGGATNYGIWLVSSDEASANTSKTFRSSSYTTADDRPKLVIDWTAPAAGGQFMTTNRGYW